MSESKVSCRIVALGLLCAFWAVILFIGVTLYSGIVQQHVAGYPNAAQFRTYIAIPAGFLISNIAVAFIRNIPAVVVGIFLALQIISFFLLFVISGGGI